MSKRMRQASWVVAVVVLLLAGYRASSSAGIESQAAKVASTEVQSTTQSADAEAADVLVPQATCSSIKCPAGQTCINTLQCTPDGDCFHVGRCVSGP